MTPKVNFLDSCYCGPQFQNYYVQMIIPDRRKAPQRETQTALGRSEETCSIAGM
jgi:hypothetical protein